MFCEFLGSRLQGPQFFVLQEKKVKGNFLFMASVIRKSEAFSMQS